MYNKLFTKILDSSIWLESSPTRIVWLTFIAAMDEAGFVQFASIGNVAARARVTIEEARAAVTCLEQPDPDSFDPDNEGRRIERVPGGWMILNAKKYRDLVTRAVSQEQTRERVQRFREKKRNGNGGVTQGNAALRSSNAKVAPSNAGLRNDNAQVTPSERDSDSERDPDRDLSPLSPLGTGGVQGGKGPAGQGDVRTAGQGDVGTKRPRARLKFSAEDYTPEFLEFWNAYPRKKDKPEAFEAWRKLAPDHQLQATILHALSWQREDNDWTREGGKYVIYPVRYLTRRRWEDERTQAPMDLAPDKHDTIGVANAKALARYRQAKQQRPGRPGPDPMRLLDGDE